MIKLSDIYINALKKLGGFNENNIHKAIDLANNDVVETLDDFIDFINFNIEDNRFVNITQPFKEATIKKAVEKAYNNKENIVHYINITDANIPRKLSKEQISLPSLLKYKGNLENLKRKRILITGSPSLSNNAKLASVYIGKVLASNGYNILSSFSNECEQNAIKGCKEAKGLSTFILPHNIEHMTSKEIEIIQSELDAKRSMVFSADDHTQTNAISIENACKCTMALADCMIIPQISDTDYIFEFVKRYLKSDNPVFLVKYKTKNIKEYNCIKTLESLGVMYLSSNTVVNQIKNTIGEALVENIGVENEVETHVNLNV